MLNTRHMVILRELMGASLPLTSEYLSGVLQVTSRTIRNDIRELELILVNHGAFIRAVRGIGYELRVEEDDQFRNFLQDIIKLNDVHQNKIPILPEERIPYLIKRLLLTESYIKFEDLASELFVSKSTIQNDIRDVKYLLEKYGITLDKRPNYGVKLVGEEVQLRFCMSEYLFYPVQANELSFNKSSGILPESDMKIIREIIVRQIKENHISLSDISLNNLVIHTAIAYKRIKCSHYVTIDFDEMNGISTHLEYKVAKFIVRELEKEFDLIFPDSEVAYIALHLLGTKLFTDLKTDDQMSPKYISPDIYKITVRMLEEIDHKLSLSTRFDKDLIAALCLHLKPAIHRYKYGMNLRNPLLNDIKLNYPIAFEAAVLAARVLKEEQGIDINENETGFIALHIGAAMERRKTNQRIKRCLIVCASGVGSAELLKCKLQSKFGSKLEIAGTTEYYRLSERSLVDIDFIISTITIEETLPVPIIKVNTILGAADLSVIKEIVNQEEEPLYIYTRKELVFLQQNIQTREEVLSFLCERLQQQGLVERSFFESVMERERFSPTSFGNYVAIPHPSSPLTDTTFWTICTLQKPIPWGDKLVQFVCLLSVARNNNSDLKRMYQLLVNLIDDASTVQQLLKCKEYREFMNVFKK